MTNTVVVCTDTFRDSFEKLKTFRFLAQRLQPGIRNNEVEGDVMESSPTRILFLGDRHDHLFATRSPAKLTKFVLEALEKSDLRSVTYGRLNLIHVFTYLDKFNS